MKNANAIRRMPDQSDDKIGDNNNSGVHIHKQADVFEIKQERTQKSGRRGCNNTPGHLQKDLHAR